MSRFWNALAAVPINAVGVLGFVVLAIGGCALLGAAWHFFPRWWPKASWFAGLRWPGRPHWRRPGRRDRAAELVADDTEDDGDDTDALPDLPAREFRSRADAFAAEGRFAEAIRERLRAIVRGLADAHVVDVRPEWTVTELAAAAAVARPALQPPLSGAGSVFSDIWYGQRPAHADNDRMMRAYETRVAELLGAGVGADA